jgi:hypothetical protein
MLTLSRSAEMIPLAVVCCWLINSPTVHGQTSPKTRTGAPPATMAAPSGNAALQLARGWNAIATGRPGEGARIADSLLADPWFGHDAIALAIAANLPTGGALAGLSAYEQWLQRSGHEDLFLLRPVARAVLDEVATGREPRMRFNALAALAEAGDTSARGTLRAEAGVGGSPIEANVALGMLGDVDALERLQLDVVSGGNRDKTPAIEALRAARGTAAAAIIEKALQDPAPPSRIAAANALAELNATASIGALREAAKDVDPAVRFMAAAALARLGSPENGVTLESLAASPVGDMRLFAASAQADRAGGGAWQAAAEALLRDADPLQRLRAAELILKRVQSPAATTVVKSALSDPSPAVRAEAAHVLTNTLEHGDWDPAIFRLLLRDPLPDTRLSGARALLLSTGQRVGSQQIGR